MKLDRTYLFLTMAIALASARLDARVLADAVADYLPALNPGDSAVFPASGSGLWMFGSVVGNDTTALEWDPGIAAGVGAFEDSDGNHTDGSIDFPFAIRSGDHIVTHPDFNEDAVFEWTAGAGESGVVVVRGHARKIDTSGGDGIGYAVFVDGVHAVGGFVASNDDIGVNFSTTTSVNTGSTVRLVIDEISNVSNDTCAVRLTISTDALLADGFEPLD